MAVGASRTQLMLVVNRRGKLASIRPAAASLPIFSRRSMRVVNTMINRAVAVQASQAISVMLMVLSYHREGLGGLLQIPISRAPPPKSPT
jgi:hypothetical protein